MYLINLNQEIGPDTNNNQESKITVAYKLLKTVTN